MIDLASTAKSRGIILLIAPSGIGVNEQEMAENLFYFIFGHDALLEHNSFLSDNVCDFIDRNIEAAAFVVIMDDDSFEVEKARQYIRENYPTVDIYDWNYIRYKIKNLLQFR